MEDKKNIVEDIKIYQGYGYSKREIKESLLYKDYTELEIDEALKNTPNLPLNNNNSSDDESPWKMVLKIILGFLILFKILRIIYKLQQ